MSTYSLHVLVHEREIGMALYIRQRNVHQKRKEKKRSSNKNNSGKIIKGNNEKMQPQGARVRIYLHFQSSEPQTTSKGVP
jgi:hypothetical protein